MPNNILVPEIIADTSLEFNWANNLKYAAFQALDQHCVGITGLCYTCKKRGKCQLLWIHDAVSKTGLHWFNNDTELVAWKKWAAEYHRLHHDKLQAVF